MLVQTPKREVEGDKAGNCFYHFDVVDYEQASLKKFTV